MTDDLTPEERRRIERRTAIIAEVIYIAGVAIAVVFTGFWLLAIFYAVIGGGKP